MVKPLGINRSKVQSASEGPCIADAFSAEGIAVIGLRLG